MIKIEYLNIDELKEYERNARHHEELDIAAIEASIRRFGFSDPVGIWKDNQIIEGHGRVMAAKRIGLKKIPCVRLDHLTDEQRRAYALAHNKTAELSGWDFRIRDDELAAVGDIDMTEFGFEDPDGIDIDSLFDEPEEKKKEPKRIQCPECGEWFEV